MKNYSRGVHIFTQQESFEQGVQELLEGSRGVKVGTLSRIVIFGKCSDAQEYERRVEFLERTVIEFYGQHAPLVSYVTQPLLSGGTFAAEVQIFEVDVEFKELNGLRYITMESEHMRRLAVCGVRGEVSDSIRAQSDSIFERIGAIFKHEDFAISDIFRQWNYIPEITAVDDNNYQYYQAFNDSRTEFYRLADWSQVGYPAATGIGMDCGAVTVNLIAVKPTTPDYYRVIPIDNDLQQAAHVYSQEVLIGVDGDKIEGKSTPKFERAKALGNSKEGYICFISGTAAIRGEESMASEDVEEQTIQTMENIEHLISESTCVRYGIEFSNNTREIHMAHTYIKYEKDTAEVERVVSERWPQTSVLYLLADVCRDELLVEIEAISTLQL